MTTEVNNDVRHESRKCANHGEYTATIKRLPWGRNGETSETRCPMCESEHEERRKQQEINYQETQRRERIAINRKAAGIPERFAGCSFENYAASTPKQQQALTSANNFAEHFDVVQEDGSSLALCGKPGCGKTHLACAIGNRVLEAGRTVIYTTVIELLRAIRDTWRRNSERSENAVIEKYRCVGLLILDEVGVSFGSEAEKVQLFDVLDGRYRDMRPTVIVSNLNGNDLKRALGSRLYDRLMHNGSDVVLFDWDSFRPRAKSVRVKPLDMSLMARMRRQRGASE
jgi:DNA replication protein DnaC